jgi:hypothetical protein
MVQKMCTRKNVEQGARKGEGCKLRDGEDYSKGEVRDASLEMEQTVHNCWR